VPLQWTLGARESGTARLEEAVAAYDAADVAGEQLLHPLQISFCIVREFQRRRPLSRSTDRLSEAVYAIEGFHYHPNQNVR
jgi:hypothetical protein